MSLEIPNSASNKYSMRDQIIEKLKTIGCYKTGDFTLKSGRKSKFYIDLRTVIQYPELLDNIAAQIAINLVKHISDFSNIAICGLPYGAIPLATLVATKLKCGLVLIRKERKQYGTKKLIEGLHDGIKKVILIDDIITSGTSIIETVEAFKVEAPNVRVDRSIVVVDREENKKTLFHTYMKSTWSLFKLKDFDETNNDSAIRTANVSKLVYANRLSFMDRASLDCIDRRTQALFQLIHEKKNKSYCIH
jgi:uridine monophosphate synthetase